MASDSTDIERLARAWSFAAAHHVDQRRKGARREPYVNHLAEVAEMVARATGGRDANLVIAAVLHDLVEDTEASLDDVGARFGTDVAMLVAEVTDDKSLPKMERKARQVQTAAAKSERAKILKLADKISNIRSLSTSPPDDWDQERRRAYLTWARAVVDGLRGVNAALEAEFDRVAAQLDTDLSQV